jgi:hypothetical protein
MPRAAGLVARAARAFLLASALIGAPSCNPARPVPPDPTPPAPPASIAQALGVDAATLVAPVDPPAPPGDLAADVAHFTSLEGCVKEHEAVDPLIADALRSIGYDTFLRDTCRIVQATKMKAVAECTPIDASALREHCVLTVSMTAKNPDACPWSRASAPELGRNPTCVAVASRDPRLCAGEEQGRRVACEALASREQSKCDAIVSPPARRECIRFVGRYRSSLDPPQLQEPLTVKGTLELHGTEGTAELANPAADLSEEASRGVVLLEARDGVRLTLGVLHDATRSIAAAPGTKVTFAVSLIVLSQTPPAARVDRLELNVPGASTIAFPGARADVHVSLAKLEHSRGGRVEMTFSGVAGVAPHAYKLSAAMVSFVRDVVHDVDGPQTNSAREVIAPQTNAPHAAEAE